MNAATAAVTPGSRRATSSVDDHDVCKHYSDGAELVEDVAGSKRRFPQEVVPRLAAIDEPVLARENCRRRRLLVR